MCGPTCIEFVEAKLGAESINGRSVLDVGSLDVNGSVRPYLRSLGPSRYVGIDIEAGPGVDEVCDVAGLVERFDEDSFDVVVSTEMVEHVRDWRGAFEQMKRVVRPGGVLLVTTCLPGFPVHAYPFDFWRYTQSDMRAIFSDFESVTVEDDQPTLSVFAVARKPIDWRPLDLSSYALYSVATRTRIRKLSRTREFVFLASQVDVIYERLVPESGRALIHRLRVRLSRSAPR